MFLKSAEVLTNLTGIYQDFVARQIGKMKIQTYLQGDFSQNDNGSWWID